jgi:signal transduction histidine kinase
MNEAAKHMTGATLKPRSKKGSRLTMDTSSFKLFKEDGKPYPVEEVPTSITMKTTKSSTKTDIVMYRVDGEKITLRVSSVPVFNPDKEMELVVTVFEDVTCEREIDRMKTEFIPLASHQLRTPLSAIRWYIEMLLDGDAGKLSTKQKEFMDSINESNLRLINLVNSLLNVSCIESGRIIIDPKPTDINTLIQGVLKDVKVEMDKKKQNVSLASIPSSHL